MFIFLRNMLSNVIPIRVIFMGYNNFRFHFLIIVTIKIKKKIIIIIILTTTTMAM